MNLKLLAFYLCTALLVLATAACKDYSELPEAELTLVSPLQAERTLPDAYTLTNALPVSWYVYQVDRLGQRSSARPLAVLQPGELSLPTELVLPVSDPTRRYYFELRNAEQSCYVSERRLPLTGADNFRDLGGLPAADGRHVKWGLFYRADKLSDLSADDITYLNSIGLATVVDLRSPEEVASSPDVLPKGAEYVHLPIYNEAEDTSNIRDRILQGQFHQEEADNLLVEVNRLLGSSEAYRFQPLIDRFVHGEGLPLAYHCTSGKDRTGFATFLLLHTLGVDSALIFDDYLMSNYFRFDRNRKTLRRANLAQYIKPINPAVIKPLMLVDPSYLQAAVDTIENSYGTVGAFMEQQFGITDSLREALRDRYLYPRRAVDSSSTLDETMLSKHSPTQQVLGDSTTR